MNCTKVRTLLCTCHNRKILLYSVTYEVIYYMMVTDDMFRLAYLALDDIVMLDSMHE